MQRVAETLSRVVGRNVKYVQVPWDQFRQSAGEEMTKMYRWFNDVGYHVDIAALRKEYPNLSTLERCCVSRIGRAPQPQPGRLPEGGTLMNRDSQRRSRQ